jgi:hypothetical protein
MIRSGGAHPYSILVGELVLVYWKVVIILCFFIMPAKRGKRTATKITTEVEEHQSNLEEQGAQQPPAKKKGRAPKPKAVSEPAEETEAPDKMSGRGRKNKADPETSNESKEPPKDENRGEATKTVPKRGQSSKKTETEKPKVKDGEVQESQRKGATRAAKRGVDVAEEAADKEQKPAKARGRKTANKNVDTVGEEPTVKKSQSQPKTKEESNETKPKRKGRQQKNALKGKEVEDKDDNLSENGSNVQDADDIDSDGRELKVVVEHW